MRDAVLVVDLGRARKAELAVEPLEVRLRADPDRGGAGEREPALHQVAAKAVRAVLGVHDDAPDRELGVLHARRQDAQVRDDARGILRPHVARGEIETVGIVVRAALLDDEHAGAQREDAVQRRRRELLEWRVEPGEVHCAKV